LNYAKEFDGTRIFNILSEVFLTAWDDLAPTLQWDQLPATATWDSFDGVAEALVANLVTDIDQPGQFELEHTTMAKQMHSTLCRSQHSLVEVFCMRGQLGNCFMTILQADQLRLPCHLRPMTLTRKVYALPRNGRRL
jgi:hypothetical protein